MSSTTGPSAPTETRAKAMAPTCACSIASFSPPSCIDGYIWTLSRALGRGVELLAEVLDRGDGRIALGVHVGSLEHELVLRQRGAG